MILIRHAQSAWNVRFGATRIDPGLVDPPLTEFGRTQAEQAVERLQGNRFERIISSPYTRTLQTAAILQRAWDLPIILDPRTGERRVFSCDIGTKAGMMQIQWPGIDFSSLEDHWWGKQVESMASFEKRCRHFIDEVQNDPRQKTTLVVTHWGFIRAVSGEAVDNTACVEILNSCEG